MRERFLREACTAAKLTHPRIVPLYSFGQSGDTVFYVMGYVDGESLESADAAEITGTHSRAVRRCGASQRGDRRGQRTCEILTGSSATMTKAAGDSED